MSEKSISVEELMTLSRREFINRCKSWMETFNEGRQMKVDNPTDCPLSQWVIYNDKKCSLQMVPNTMNCPICGNPCCPDCMNHAVSQLSRVTGYLSTVDNWNAAKKQEFEDRNRYNL